MTEEKITIEDLLKQFPKLEESKTWLAPDNHSLKDENGISEYGINLNPSEIDGYPKIAVQLGESNKWFDRKQLSHKIEFSLKSVISKESLYRYYVDKEKKEGFVEITKRFTIPVNLSIDSEITLLLEVSDKYPNPPWSVLSNIDGIEIIYNIYPKFLKDAPSISARRVAGLEKEKERLKCFMLSTLQEDWGLPEERGIILGGAPGTGKTELVMEVCQEEYGEIPVIISGPEILSKWVGESEKFLRQKFNKAWNRKTGRIIYIDELDAIARSREEATESYASQIVAQLLVLLDGIEAKKQIAKKNGAFKVIASTNLGHVVDPALKRPGRLGSEPIRFDLPNKVARTAILHHYLEKIHRDHPDKLDDDLKKFVRLGNCDDNLKEIIISTTDFSGADIEDFIVGTINKKILYETQTLNSSTLLNYLRTHFTKSSMGISSEPIRIDTGGISHEEDRKISASYFTLPKVISADEAKDLAKYHFNMKGKQSEGARTYKFRKLELSKAISTDWLQTKENIIQSFIHSSEEQVCLYIPDFENLRKCKDESPVLKIIWGLIHELYLSWSVDNLLIVYSLQKIDLPGKIKIRTNNL